MDSQAEKARLETEIKNEVLLFKLSGSWKTGYGVPDFGALPDPLQIDTGVRKIAVDVSALGSWDSMLMTFLIKCLYYCKTHHLIFVQESLPPDVQKLLNLSQAVPEKKDLRGRRERQSLLQRLGERGIEFYRGVIDSLSFTGACVGSLGKLMRGRARLRGGDFFIVLQEVGAHALPIVTLISFLVGLIIAFLGAVVLQRFAAQYYVSYLVGYGMLREMGAVMTGVIVAGRTGAAFAAQIGSMKVTEEIDALKTLGISPIDFIVLPRMLALFIMMPLLVIYADIIGLIGGLLVSYSMLDIAAVIFVNGMKEAVSLTDFYLGVVKGTLFGVLIAVSGCLRGMQCDNSADAVGLAATSAVVTGITSIVFANAVIDWIAAIYKI